MVVDADTAVAALKKLGAYFGRNEQGNVVGVTFLGPKGTDARLVHLRGLTKLKGIGLMGTQTMDAGMVHLQGLTNP